MIVYIAHLLLEIKLPCLTDQEKRQREEEAAALANMQVAREAAIAKMASDTDKEVSVFLDCFFFTWCGYYFLLCFVMSVVV